MTKRVRKKKDKPRFRKGFVGWFVADPPARWPIELITEVISKLKFECNKTEEHWLKEAQQQLRDYQVRQERKFTRRRYFRAPC